MPDPQAKSASSSSGAASPTSPQKAPGVSSASAQMGTTSTAAGAPKATSASTATSAADAPKATSAAAAADAPKATSAATTTSAPKATSASTATSAPKATGAATASASQGAAAAEATWSHPTMKMSFAYPPQLLKVRQKPDGATLESEILGVIEDRSGEGKDKPTPLTITVSVRAGNLLTVMKSNRALQLPTIFPAGTEASFKEEKGFADRITVAGNAGYRIHTGSHDVQQEFVYAPLPPSSTIEVLCNYVGDMAKPKVPMATQKKACDRVLATLAIKL